MVPRMRGYDILPAEMTRPRYRHATVLFLFALALGACTGPAGFLGIGSRDLGVSDVQFTVTSQQLVGVSFTLTATRRGGVEDAPWRVLLSPSTELASDAPVVATGTATLAGGERVTVELAEPEIADFVAEQELSIPLDQYYVFVQLFYDDTATDADSSNNLALNPVSQQMFVGDAAGVFPDLAVDSLTVSDNGSYVSALSIAVSNTGVVDVSGAIVRIELVEQGTGERLMLLEEPVDLPVDGSISDSLDFAGVYASAWEFGTLNVSPPFGTYRVEASITKSNLVESNVTNNVRSSADFVLSGTAMPPQMEVELVLAEAGFGDPVNSSNPLEIVLVPESLFGAGSYAEYVLSFDSPGTVLVGLDDLLSAGVADPDNRYRVLVRQFPNSEVRFWSAVPAGLERRLPPSWDLMADGSGLVRFDNATVDPGDSGLPPDTISVQFLDPPWLFQAGDEDIELSPGDDPVTVQIERPYDSAVFRLAGPDPGFTGRLWLDELGTADAVDRVRYSEWISDGTAITGSDVHNQIFVPEWRDLLVQNGETAYIITRRGDIDPFALGSYRIRYTQYGPAWPEVLLGYGLQPDPVGSGLLTDPELVSSEDTFGFSPPVGSSEYVLRLTSVVPEGTLRVWFEDASSPGAPSSHADIEARIEIERNNDGTYVDVTPDVFAVSGAPARDTGSGYRIDDPYTEPARYLVPADATNIRIIVGPYGGGTFIDPAGPDPEQTFRFAFDYE